MLHVGSQALGITPVGVAAGTFLPSSDNVNRSSPVAADGGRGAGEDLPEASQEVVERAWDRTTPTLRRIVPRLAVVYTLVALARTTDLTALTAAPSSHPRDERRRLRCLLSAAATADSRSPAAHRGRLPTGCRRTPARFPAARFRRPRVPDDGRFVRPPDRRGRLAARGFFGRLPTGPAVADGTLFVGDGGVAVAALGPTGRA